MTKTLRALAAVSAFLLAGPALAQQPEPPDEDCLVQPPKIPVVDWSGQAAYRAVATVKRGKVVAVEVAALTTGVGRRAQRSLVYAITEALQTARCQPGDRIFEKTFLFDIPPAAAASAASDAGH